MTIEQHLRDRLKNPQQFALTSEELKRIKFEGIAEHLYRRLTSTQFRKSSLDAEAKTQIKKAMSLNVESNRPLKFTYPFGGYKTFRVPSFPGVDWAEFLAISHVIRYVRFVTAGYSPGAEIYFSSDDVVIEKIDNYKRADLDTYATSFKALLAKFSEHLPGNIKLSLQQVVPDIYNQSEYNKELEAIVKAMRQDGLPSERRDALKRGFDFNFKANGKIDYAKTPKNDLTKIIEDLMFYSDGYLKLQKRRDFVRGEDKIVLFSTKITNAIDIGSTTVSKAKFWAGTGVLETVNGKMYDRILSPKQFESSRKNARVEKSALIDLPNFHEILVFDERLNFLG